MTRSSRSGQTLIEILIAITLIVMVLLTLVAGLTLGIRNNRFAKDQVLAKDYTRAAIESLRDFRSQLGWEAFFAAVSADGQTSTYCLPTLPQTVAEFIALSNNVCLTSDVIPATTYKRDVQMTIPAGKTDEIQAKVRVLWMDGTKSHESTSTIVLKQWN